MASSVLRGGFQEQELLPVSPRTHMLTLYIQAPVDAGKLNYKGLSKPITKADSRVNYLGLIRKARSNCVVNSVIPPVTMSIPVLIKLLGFPAGSEALL